MKSHALLTALACSAACLAAAPAHALVTLTLNWTDAECGVAGSPSFDCIDTLRVTGAPDQSVFVRATLHVEYHDQGLPLPPGSWVFPSSVRWPLVYETHEVGAIYFHSNACASYGECSGRPPGEWGSFNFGADPYVLGRNTVPDHLSVDYELLATGNGLAFVSALGMLMDARGADIRSPGITPAIPEPATWALMAAGLAALGLARRRNR